MARRRQFRPSRPREPGSVEAAALGFLPRLASRQPASGVEATGDTGMTVDITPKAPPMSLPKCLFSPLSGHVRERPVAIVMEQRAVKLQIGFLEGGNRRAVHQVNVKVSVVEDS